MIKKQLFLLLSLQLITVRALVIEVPRYPLDYPAFTYLPQQSQFGKYAQSRLPLATASIGIYGKTYNFPVTYGAVIELDPAMLTNKLPNSLEQALRVATGLNYQQFVSRADHKVYSFIVIAPLLQSNNVIASVYNVVYHFFYELISEQPRFAANILMGLFEPTNISGTDANGIPLNKFGQVHMSTHPGGGPYAISPNNATFKVDIKKQVAGCWLAALAPNKKQLSITYLVMLPKEMVLTIVQQIHAIGSIADWFTLLQNMADTLQGATRATFLAAVATIKNLLIRQPQAPEEELLVQLHQLLEQLKTLQAMLQMI